MLNAGNELLTIFPHLQLFPHVAPCWHMPVFEQLSAKACVDVVAVVKGKQIPNEINRLGWLEREYVLGNSVVNMYAKCGALAKAEGVLYELLVRDVVSWSLLIARYA